jgi:hypothetical protein
LGKGKTLIGTHTRPDVDVLASLWILQTYGDEKLKKAAKLFLKGGDEELTQMTGIILIDRGRGEFDHHGRTNMCGETSTSLVAKKLGIADEKPIQQLLALVRRSDLQGISEPFDASDLIKCLQRSRISDEEIIKIGVRIIQDTIEFRKNALARDNQWVREIIFDFLKEKMVVPPKFQRYLELLANPRFQREFDLVEIGVAEKTRSKKEAEDFIKKLLEVEYEDSGRYLEAIEIVKNAWKKKVNELIICAAITDNSKFNPAARAEAGAAIIVQRNSQGHNQIYFDSQKVSEQIMDSIASAVRLEECLVQKRKIPKCDLRKPGRIEEIPEWYYYVAPTIVGKKKKPGRFILNGSLTAPDVPPSRIPWETLLYVIECAVRYQPFNWVRWRAERIALYMREKT